MSAAIKPEPVFLNVAEVADLLRVKKRTIYDWVATGKIPHYKPSRFPLFDRDEVIGWARSARAQPRVAVTHLKR